MSILTNCEIKCDCGEKFEAEVWKAVNIFDDPDLKEVVLSGRFNTVCCPKCHKVFYKEHFFIYQDLANELIAYVYPKDGQNMAAQYREKMLKDFKAASAEIEGFEEIDFEPVLFFGIEDLIQTIQNEDYNKDEIDILNFIAKEAELELIKIKPSVARNLGIVHTIPKIKKSRRGKDSNSGSDAGGEKYIEKDIKKDIVAGLEALIKYNPNLVEYGKLLERIKSNVSCLDEILRHKKIKKAK